MLAWYMATISTECNVKERNFLLDISSMFAPVFLFASWTLGLKGFGIYQGEHLGQWKHLWISGRMICILRGLHTFFQHFLIFLIRKSGSASSIFGCSVHVGKNGK